MEKEILKKVKKDKNRVLFTHLGVSEHSCLGAKIFTLQIFCFDGIN